MRFISVCSGIGGLDLGLERAGMTCIAQVEKDDYCRRVLAKHWPHMPRFVDMYDFGKDVFNEPTDLIAGGIPCQPHSQAGQQRGAADDRDLWPEHRRLVGEYRPRWALVENVPGIRHTMLDQVLSDLEGMDYATRTIVVPACAFGAPHIRERVFIVAHIAGKQGGRIQQRGIQADIRAGCEAMAYTNGNHGYRRGVDDQVGRQWQPQEAAGIGHTGRTQWATEPSVGRVAHGVPHRVDRLRGLGNAVVPQVAEWIGRQILQADNS